MKKVTIYTSGTCPYCIMAKELLKKKNVDLDELSIDINPEYIDEAIKKSGGRKTVPQIFVDDYHIGGYDDLSALEDKGELDPLLKD